GCCFVLFSKQKAAHEMFQQVIASDTEDTETWLGLAQIYYEDDDEKNLALLEEMANSRLKNSPQFFVGLGVLAQQHGDFERSRRALEKASKQMPEDIDVRAALAGAYLQLGFPELAIRVVEEAELDGASDEVKTRRDKLVASLLLET